MFLVWKNMTQCFLEIFLCFLKVTLIKNIGTFTQIFVDRLMHCSCQHHAIKDRFTKVVNHRFKLKLQISTWSDQRTFLRKEVYNTLKLHTHGRLDLKNISHDSQISVHDILRTTEGGTLARVGAFGGLASILTKKARNIQDS